MTKYNKQYSAFDEHNIHSERDYRVSNDSNF